METSDQCETIGLTECANYQLFFYIETLLRKISHCIHAYAMVKKIIFHHYEYRF